MSLPCGCWGGQRGLAGRTTGSRQGAEGSPQSTPWSAAGEAEGEAPQAAGCPWAGRGQEPGLLLEEGQRALQSPAVPGSSRDSLPRGRGALCLIVQTRAQVLRPLGHSPEDTGETEASSQTEMMLSSGEAGTVLAARGHGVCGWHRSPCQAEGQGFIWLPKEPGDCQATGEGGPAWPPCTGGCEAEGKARKLLPGPLAGGPWGRGGPAGRCPAGVASSARASLSPPSYRGKAEAWRSRVHVSRPWARSRPLSPRPSEPRDLLSAPGGHLFKPQCRQQPCVSTHRHGSSEPWTQQQAPSTWALPAGRRVP